jgi:protein SCO1/2
MKRWIIVGAALALALAGFGGMAWWAGQGRAHAFSGIVAEPPVPVADFTLTAQAGKALALSDLRGQWALVFYGYTSCPDVCPTTLATLRRVREALGAGAGRVQIVFISIDPDRDTPEAMNTFIGRFGPGFVGLTGRPDQIAAAAKSLGVTYNRVNASSAPAGYLMSHSAFVYLLDPGSRLRVTYPFGVSVKEMTADLNYLFAATP